VILGLLAVALMKIHVFWSEMSCRQAVQCLQTHKMQSSLIVNTAGHIVTGGL